ncbi:hypothetical protein BU15DRAFT_45785, partial [Melanogaster broomeanus]
PIVTYHGRGFHPVQYSCEPAKLPSAELRLHCFPILRIFKICPNQPAVEITTSTTIDMKTGEIEIPAENSTFPKGKPWRDIHLYSNTDS